MHAMWNTCRNCIARNQRNSRNNELGKPSPVLSKIFQLTMNFDESVRAVRDPGPRRPVGGRKDSGAQPSPPPHSKLHLFLVQLQTFRAPLRPRAQGPTPASDASPRGGRLRELQWRRQPAARRRSGRPPALAARGVSFAEGPPKPWTRTVTA